MTTPRPSNRVIIYFHGNAEDAGVSLNFFPEIIRRWNCHLISVEYPTYGVYKNGTPISQKNIFEDSEDLYDYIVEKLGLKQSQIFVFGRSIGTGPACHLSSVRPIAGLILFSAYQSIKAIANEKVGFLRIFVSDRFVNIEAIKKINAPTILIHGKQDKVIGYQHSEKLYE